MTLLSVTDETMVNPLRIPATTGARARAVIIDAVLISILAVALMGASILVLHRPHLGLLSAILAVIVLIREADLTFTGYSVGGRVAGVRWVDARTDSHPGIGMFFHADLVLITIVPTLGFGSLLLLSSAAKDKNRRGWHDRISGLIAVSTKDPFDEELEEFDDISLMSTTGTLEEVPEEFYRADAEDPERLGPGQAPVNHSVYESSRGAKVASTQEAEAAEVRSEAPVFASVVAAASAARSFATSEPVPVVETASQAEAKANVQAGSSAADTEVLPAAEPEPTAAPAVDSTGSTVEPATEPKVVYQPVPEPEVTVVEQAAEPVVEAAEATDVKPEAGVEPVTESETGARVPAPAESGAACEPEPTGLEDGMDDTDGDGDVDLKPMEDDSAEQAAVQATELVADQQHPNAEAEFEQVAQSILGAAEEVTEATEATAATEALAGTAAGAEQAVSPAVAAEQTGSTFQADAVIPPVSRGSGMLNEFEPFNTVGEAATADNGFVAVSATSELDADESSSFGVVPPVEEVVGAPRSAPSPSEQDDHYELVKEVFARRAAARAAEVAANGASGPSIATFDSEDISVSPAAEEAVKASSESSQEIVDDTLIDASLVDGQTTGESMIEVPEGESLDSYFADALINDDDAISAESAEAESAEQVGTIGTEGPSHAFVDDRSEPVIRLMPFTNAGRAIHVTGPTIIGRAPLNTSRYPEAKLVALGDSAPSVSKTHAAMMPTEHGILVTDLGSSNGTRVVRAGKARRIPTDVAVMVHEGGVVLLGQTAYRVQR
ncbi:RDD family protein [Actinomyces trachealis]|uniref:RDD family protein n=1 Tax=Actinomyces trachealis TaxID=2763540 RepID=UPI001C552BC7|nr:RDD family protein [Actinomyces trachealis]